MTQLNAYLHFNGNCREAMTFYKESLGGDLEMMTVGDSPMGAQMPPEAQKNILHATLKNGGFVIMASDIMGPGGVTKGNNLSLTLVCSSQKETETLFSKLAAGGKVTHALKEEFFGLYGDLTDKHGINWMFNYEKPKA
jgi:PhnB protein